MKDKDTVIYIGQGLIRSIFFTLALLIVYCIITYYTKSNSKIDSVYIVVLTALSVMYGSIYSVKKIQKKGWVIGFIISILYIMIIYLVSILNGRELALSSYSILRIVLAIFVGTLSGMLGVNI